MVVESIIDFLSNQNLVSWTTLALTILAGYVTYYNHTSPRTEFRDVAVDKDGEEFGFTLKNVGLTEATFRVRMWVDGEDPRPKMEEFDNCLFAQNPLPAPWSDGAYPKRSNVKRRDFRQFSTTFPWVPEDQSLPPLPVTKDKHEVRLEVQQSGENYIFTYTADGEQIEDLRLSHMYGGNHLMGWLRKKWYFWRYSD